MHFKIFLVLFYFITIAFSFAQKKIKIYKTEQLVNRISYQDTIYVINFWASWCKPCVEELGVFEKLNNDSLKTNIKVLLVSLDFKEDIRRKLKPFLQKKKIKSEVILLDESDATTFIPKLDNRWSGAIPATLVKNGNKKCFQENKLTDASLLKLINNSKK